MSFERIPLSGSIRLALEVFTEIQGDFDGMYEGCTRECEIEDCRAREIWHSSDPYGEARREVQFFVKTFRIEVKKILVTLHMASGYGNVNGKWARYNWCCRKIDVVQIYIDGSTNQYEIEPSDR